MVENPEVLVMTPDNLLHSFFRLKDITLLIFVNPPPVQAGDTDEAPGARTRDGARWREA